MPRKPLTYVPKIGTPGRSDKPRGRSPIRSIRCPEHVWAEIKRRAVKRGESVTAYLLRRGLETESDK